MEVDRLYIGSSQVIEVCIITGISKIEFFNFSVAERIKQNQKLLKTIQNLVSL